VVPVAAAGPDVGLLARGGGDLSDKTGTGNAAAAPPCRGFTHCNVATDRALVASKASTTSW